MHGGRTNGAIYRRPALGVTAEECVNASAPDVLFAETATRQAPHVAHHLRALLDFFGGCRIGKHFSDTA